MGLVLFKKHTPVESKKRIRAVLEAYNKEHDTEFEMHETYGYITGSVHKPDISNFKFKNSIYSAIYGDGCFYPYLAQIS